MLAFVGWDLWQIARGVPREARYATAQRDGPSLQPGMTDAVDSGLSTKAGRERLPQSAAVGPRLREDD
jgi:hypothetical protein